MDKIETLSSIEGRALLFEIFNELRYEKQLSSIATLTLCWRICTHERDIYKYVKKEVQLVHTLGFFSGSALWMEEIVNRFYYSSINSFVYLGAAVLLVLIGVRRFSDSVSDNLVIFGVGFEALMLLFMFVVMIFSPHDDTNKPPGSQTDDQNSVTDLIIEVGEIATDFAAVVVQMEQLNDSLQNMVKLQNEMIDSVNVVADITSQAVSPNPKMLESMRETNDALGNFKETVESLNETVRKLNREEIEYAVRKEVERILVDKIVKQ